MAVGGGDGERSLQNTPTWAVALVCAVFVIISVLIERGIQSLGELFRKRHKKEMSEVLEKIKAELMLLGFISLLLTVGTKPISEMCISEKASTFMLPCKKETTNNGGGGDDHCSKHNKVPLVSQTGIHQLHIFIFVLGIVHVLYSIFTIALAKAKMKKWQSWESETSSLEYEYSTDASRFRFVRQTSFVQRHTAGVSTTPGLRWIVAFLRQFFHSVTKVDYLTLRHGFINAHFAQNRKFNFHNYIKRSMEDDFKVVVGVSLPLWACTILFLSLNVYGWYTFIWISFVPLAIMLIVGAKFELIIMEMAQQIQNKTAVVKGVPVVEPSNKYFWFNRPDIILFLVHFSLFQNAFQMAFFLWTLYEFGLSSCFHENHAELIARHLFAVVLQCFCSYVTFPLYALVTQMGSHMKKAIFEEQTAKALKNWQKAAKERKRLRNKERGGGGEMSPGFMSPVSTPSRGSSPLHLLHKYKPSSGSDIETGLPSPKPYYSGTELSDMDGCPPSTREQLEPSGESKNPNANGGNHEQEPTRQNNKNPNEGEKDGGDFSFAMSSKT